MEEETTTQVAENNTPTEQVGTRGTSLLEQLGISSTDVLTPTNVEQTITEPVEPTDVLGIFKQQEQAANVPALQEAYKKAQSDFLKAQDLAKQQQLTIEGRAKKLGVLRGEQAQAAGQAALDLGTLETAQQLAFNALSSAQAQAQQRAGILYNEYQTKVQMQMKYPGLKINPFTDDYTKVGEKVEEYIEKQEKKAQKEYYKEQLLAMGKSVKGLSRNELEKKLKKANKAAYNRAEEEAEIRMKSLRMDLAKQQKALQEVSEAPQTAEDVWAQYLENTGGTDYTQETTNSYYSPTTGYSGYSYPVDLYPLD